MLLLHHAAKSGALTNWASGAYLICRLSELSPFLPICRARSNSLSNLPIGNDSERGHVWPLTDLKVTGSIFTQIWHCTLLTIIGGQGGCRAHYPEGTDLQSAAFADSLPAHIYLVAEALELNQIKTTYEAAWDTYLPPAICCNFSILYRSYSCHKDLWYATSNSNRDLMHFECISSANWDSGAY